MAGNAAFEGIDLDRKCDKPTYERTIPGLAGRLGGLQRRAKDANVPVIVTFDGWNASGKGVQMNRLLMALDPHGFRAYAINAGEGDGRPFFYRFWEKTPPKGYMAFFSRSWYGLTLDEAVGEDDKKMMGRRFSEANAFEKALTDDGCLVVKLFLHISREEQRSRLEHMEKDPVEAWLVSKADWRQNKKYGRYLKAVGAMIEKTDTGYAPWTIVEADDKRFATVKIMETVIGALERRLAPGHKAPVAPQDRLPVPAVLRDIDLSKALAHEEYKRRLEPLQGTLRRLQAMAYRKGVPVVIAFEGWDAAGKSGGIQRLTEAMDPRGYRVNPTTAPDDVEKAHHYLWRFWRDVPATGHVAIFDRSWYGRVLVERVEGLAPPRDWRRAYGEINGMERELADFGAVIVKLWLHISRAEQLERFERRELNPFKSYKITEEDWRNREKWKKYVAAADEMFARTDTEYAPWTIVESNDKYYSRIKVLETVIAALERKIGSPP